MTETSALEQKYIGTEVGSFQIRSLLGMGGMGAVFLAEHKMVALSAAIKFLRDPLADAEHAGRMLTEARALSHLEHPNLVRLNDCGSLPDGTLYLQMEYLRGQPLPEYVRDHGGKLPLRQVLVLGRQLASALSYVHGRKILHRDLKPSNLYVTADAEVEGGQRIKILDFGLAKLWSVGAGQGSTGSNQLLGTPRYMSPEQCEGTAELDDRTDVYSLGLILFELLTGESPYAVPNMTPTAWLYAHVQRFPRGLRKLLPTAPAELEALISQMLDKLAVQRPNMVEVEARLQALLSADVLPKPSLRFPPPQILKFGFALLLLGMLTMLAGFALWPPGALRRLRSWVTSPRPSMGVVNVAVLAAGAPTGMALIQGRSFPMGSREDEIEAAWRSCQRERSDCKREEYERERPQRVVTVSDFYLDQHEVTNEDYAAFLNLPLRPTTVEDKRLVLVDRVLLVDLHPAAGGIAYTDGTFAARPGYARRPVVQVTWVGAQEYCAAKGRRLPTEAEWELAARSAGGAQGKAAAAWPWGNAPPRCAEVVIARHEKGSCRAVLAGLSPLALGGPLDVGSAPQDVTPQGVHDLAGNVREWVEDEFQVPYLACGLCENPKVPARGAGGAVMRVVRGGSFMQEPTAARSAGRSRWRADYLATGIGFRCASSIAQTPHS